MIPYLKLYHKQDVLSYTRIRRYETKIGERIQVLPENADIVQVLAASSARFVLVGVPEDAGVKANLGVGGAATAWTPFLQAFLNMQSNDFFSGEELLLLGWLDFLELDVLIERNAQTADERMEAYRHAVRSIDDSVEAVVKMIVAANKIPVVIGGGRNNAYGCIKGAAKGMYKAGRLPLAQINAVHLGAHAGYHPAEGRHSGNAFRYAEEDGYLEKYCIVGLKESHLTQNAWIDIVNNPFIDVLTFEDIFVHEKRNFRQAVLHALDFTAGSCGIELSLDVIEHTLSSDTSPVGVTAVQARQFVTLAAAAQPVYLHIAEGAIQLEDGRRNESAGKLLGYLVTDFVKGMQGNG